MFNHSHIRHFSSVFVSLRDFELITQNSSENITSRQSRCIYVNVLFPPIYNNSKLRVVLQLIIIVNCRTKIAPQHLDTDERDKNKICIFLFNFN